MKAVRSSRVAFLVLAVAASSGGAAVYTVGADGACTHSNLSSALLAAAFNDGPDEVRLARNLTYSNQFLHLTNWDPDTAGALTLAGGYDTCNDVSASGRTTVDGGPSQPVVLLDATAGNDSVLTLRRLLITGSGERGIVADGQVDLELVDEAVQQNDGGLRIANGAIVEIGGGSSVFDNDTISAGAGNACIGSGLVLDGVVQSNDTVADGGGIHADGCVVSLLDSTLIYANSAFDGGGIYATGGSFVQALGGTFGVEIQANDATRHGGGAFVEGATTSIVFSGAEVEFNFAVVHGGGLYADAGALISMDRAGSCGGRSPCSSLSRNYVSAAGGDPDGAAAFAAAGGEVRLFQTVVHQNDADDVGASALEANGGGAALRLEGVSF